MQQTQALVQQENALQEFDGMQDSEKLLYVARPHWLMKLLGFTKVAVFGALAYFAWQRAGTHIPAISESILERGSYAVIGISLVGLWWVNKYCSRLRAYVTDRRIMRFEAVFPVTEKRRSLMWKEVAKTRGKASNFVWRLVKIGELEVVPKILEGKGEMSFPYIHYFEDLASYIDKVVYTSEHEPDNLDDLRPFVAAPRGKRY